MASLRPSTVVELAEALSGMHRRGEKLGAIDLGALARVLEHSPEDMTVTVEAGLTLAALQSRLAQHGQWLPIDPPKAATLTIADLLNEDRSGPRRFGYGTIREHLIGLQVVLADGRVIRNGGKVVKNVAGYDLCKLFVGARGTIGIIVEATFKLRPLPQAERVVTAPCDSSGTAAKLIEAVLDSELTPTVLDLHSISNLKSQISNQLVLALAGTREEVEWQLSQAAALGIREPASLDYEANFWSLPSEPHRISVLPSCVAGMIQSLGQNPWVARAGNGVIYHRSSLAPAPAGDGFSAGSALPLPVRNERREGRPPSAVLLRRTGGEGHPTADTPARLQTRPPSSPQPSPPSAGGEGEDSDALYKHQAGSPTPLLRRIKDAYDPKHVFPDLTL